MLAAGSPYKSSSRRNPAEPPRSDGSSAFARNAVVSSGLSGARALPERNDLGSATAGMAEYPGHGEAGVGRARRGRPARRQKQ